MIAGTNGKGSTVATLCALLDAVGYQYGSYTSPHLVSYNERVRVNGKKVSDQVLLQSFERVEEARGEVSLSYFEFGTLAAIDILTRAELDFAVMEVGLGGRLDAVNLLDADCAVITPIGLDHQLYLGNDLESIGREKAGIIRPAQPVFSGESRPPQSIVDTARLQGAELHCLGVDFSIERDKRQARFVKGEVDLNVPLPVLKGPHQLGNMGTALAAFLELVPEAAAQPDSIARGIASVSLAGRFQRINQKPAIWVDVGHNPMAAQAVAVALGEAMASEGITRCRCVLAMLVDKDATAVVEELKPLIDGWYCAGLGSDRGQSGADLAQRAGQAGGNLDIKVYEVVGKALDAAASDSGPDEAVLVFGSFLTATEALLHWPANDHDK